MLTLRINMFGSQELLVFGFFALFGIMTLTSSSHLWRKTPALPSPCQGSVLVPGDGPRDRCVPRRAQSPCVGPRLDPGPGAQLRGHTGPALCPPS